MVTLIHMLCLAMHWDSVSGRLHSTQSVVGCYYIVVVTV